MTTGVESLQQHIEALGALSDVRPEVVSGDTALEWATRIAQVRHATDALLAPFAARIDELSDPARTVRYARYKGHPNAASLLSARAGLSVAEAHKIIGLGKTLAAARASEDANAGDVPDAEAGSGDTVASVRVPDAAAGVGDDGDALLEPVLVAEDKNAGVTVGPSAELDFGAPESPAPPAPYSLLAAAILNHSIGTEKATLIRRTLEDMTVGVQDAERLLVDRAPSMTIPQFRRLCLTTLAKLDPEALLAREERQHRARSLRFYEEPDGMVAIYGKLAPADAAYVRAWLDPAVKRNTDAQRDFNDDERRNMGQIYADCFVAAMRHLTGCTKSGTRSKTTVVVRIAKSDLEQELGYGTCDGISAPLSAAKIRRMAVDAEILPVIMGGGSLPLDMGTAERFYTWPQRIALGERDQGCAMCTEPASLCDAHHIKWWKWGGTTDLTNGVLLCVGCHHRVHDFGWDIEVTRDGAVRFRPPAGVDPQRRWQPSRSARLAA